MQVPEKLALIGGSILLSSTLIFTLKSQASQILPKISDASNKIFDHIGDTQKNYDFDSNYQQAQQKGWKTGSWGTAKYYVDDQHNMFVGRGELQAGATLRNTLGDNDTDNLKTLNITQPVQAPQDSGNLFSTSNGPVPYNSNLEQINGLENVDTSQVTTMYNMFTNDIQLREINGIDKWNTSKVNGMGWMFYANKHLQNLNISNFDMSNVSSKPSMLANTFALSKITLGNKSDISETSLTSTNWKQNNSVIGSGSLNTNHAGTWIKQ